MTISYDDEVLPMTPADVGTPFIFAPSIATQSLFATPFYPTQNGNKPKPNFAGEYRGLYGTANQQSSKLWKPEWSFYKGDRNGKPHWGVDIYAPTGTQVVAVIGGELSFANQPKGLGLYAILRFNYQGKVYAFHYGHLNAKINAERTVVKGEPIGYVGCSGNADTQLYCSTPYPGHDLQSSHVHFALVPPTPTNELKRANPLGVLGWQLDTPSKPDYV